MTRHGLSAQRPVQIALPDEAATVRLGQILSRLVQPGDAVLLSGPLGAGKSCLARALIRALTSDDEEVPSPTFTLVQTYEATRGDLTFGLAHLDLYRIEDPDEVAELGLDDLLEDGVALIEWPQRLGPHIPTDCLIITLAPEGEGRLASLRASGSWEGREFDDVG
jgi:tRNA threonylcarbamoyladenosine biosynthesis protein TsaE